MAKPASPPVDPQRLVELALAVVKADRFPHLASIDGDQPRVRPVSPCFGAPACPPQRPSAAGPRLRKRGPSRFGGPTR